MRRPLLLKVPKLLLEHFRPPRKLRRKVLTRYQKLNSRRLMLLRKPRNLRRLKLKRRKRSSKRQKRIQLKMLESKRPNFTATQKESWRKPRLREKKLERNLSLIKKMKRRPSSNSKVLRTKSKVQ